MKIFLILSMIMVTSSLAIAGGETLDEKKEKARETAAEITQMRSERARDVIGSETGITPAIFKEVCGKVGKRAKEIAKENGFRIRHAAVKNRNPKNAATEEELEIIERFAEDTSLKESTGSAVIEGREHYRHTAPIYVEKACLACHGDKDKRPAFIKEKYPNDRAYGFKEGDLRGIISVSFPL